MSERDVMVGECVCGGWVMVASIKYADDDTWAEAGRMASKGFTIRSRMAFDDFLAMDACEHRGACTTDPETIRVQQQEIAP